MARRTPPCRGYRHETAHRASALTALLPDYLHVVVPPANWKSVHIRGGAGFHNPLPVWLPLDRLVLQPHPIPYINRMITGYPALRPGTILFIDILRLPKIAHDSHRRQGAATVDHAQLQ